MLSVLIDKVEPPDLDKIRKVGQTEALSFALCRATKVRYLPVT